MNTYHLYLKSHTEAPDFEDDIMADSKEEAVDYFFGKLGHLGWEREVIESNVAGEDEINNPITENL